ncbi:MAG: glycosyltransferase family 4 protein, partial [Magnetococcales bacterium]|nr:glycosyltransferase family 4 protein [Magnetococcales bacterium]
MADATKIIFLNRYFAPDHAATSQLLSDLAFDLAERGERVHVISSRLRYDDPQARLPPREQLQGVQVHRVWSSRFGRHFLPGRAIDYLTFHWSAAVQLFRLARRGDRVVVKTDPPLLSVSLAPVIRLRGARLLTWNQDLFPEVAAALGVRGLGRWGVPLLQGLRNRSLRQATHNVVLGDRMADRLRQAGIAQERLHIIHNWSDGQAITPMAAEANPLRQAWGLEGRFVVGYSGNLGRAHELETLLDAATLLKERRDICFLFIGGGAGQARLADQIKARQLTQVYCKPYQPQAQLTYSLTLPDLHWISLLPALEGLIVPSKFYGIAAAGRATLYIGDAQGEIPMLLRSGGCGVTLAIGDSQGVARQIAAWAEDRRACQQMGQAARQLFLRRFDRPIALAAWRALLM